ncbi:MAG: hypothetical protein LJE59_03105 [Chromatiaceae bacterium]|nr:hypothetical protein [Chromatiaceae bacterium]
MLVRWSAMLERFAALSTRERLLIVLALFAVAYQLADLVILDRQSRRIQQLQADIARDRAAIVLAGSETAALNAQAQQDPNAALRDDMQQVRNEMEQLQSRLKAATAELISPQDMAKFLEELLIQEHELRLLRLQTLEVKPLLEQAAQDTTGAVALPALHRHGFDIEFAGGYMATLRYLKALESLPWRFFWDSVSYEVLDYPNSVVRLRLHTLSLSEDWIGV